MTEDMDRYRASLNNKASATEYPTPPRTALADILAQTQRLERAQAAERAELADRHRRERAALLARALLHTSVDGSSSQVDPMSDLMTPGAAVNLSGLSRATIHRLCVENEIDENNDNGIALWSEDEGRYRISRSRLLALLVLRNGR